MSFSFEGSLPSSKSLLNRALILQSFNPEIVIESFSQCDDVVLMQKALKDFSEGLSQFDCGSAGTVLRFLALRVSRKPGTYYLRAKGQLLKRPQTELIKTLSQLSCQAIFDKKGLHIVSSGWAALGDGFHISAQKSSQFASAFLLSAWNLNFSCCVSLGDDLFSESYLKMTIALCRAQGMDIDYTQKSPYEIYVTKNQNLKPSKIIVEPDMTSASAIAAIAAVGGVIKLRGFPVKSIQGDVAFLNILQELGAEVEFSNLNSKMGVLSVRESSIFKTSFSGHFPDSQKVIKGFNLCLKNTPDLFPVLAALAGLLSAESIFYNISHIAYKESNRLLEMKQLLNLLGREVVLEKNTFTIKALMHKHPSDALSQEIYFDTKEDHRLVMAAYVLKASGFKIKCSSEACVSKSFPEFLELTKNLDS